MPKKKLSKSKGRQVGQSDAAKRATRYQKTLKAIKEKHGIDHRTAQATYRHLRDSLSKGPINRNDIVQHPRITANAIRSGKRDVVRQGRNKKENIKARDYSEKIIAQAIKELETNGLPKHFATGEIEVGPPILVKITIRGKDYSKQITGTVTERKGSKILGWKWKNGKKIKH